MATTPLGTGEQQQLDDGPVTARAQSSSGKGKPMTIEVRSKKALGDVFALFGYKSGSK